MMTTDKHEPVKDMIRLAFLMERAAAILEKYDWKEAELEAVQNILASAEEDIELLSERTQG